MHINAASVKLVHHLERGGTGVPLLFTIRQGSISPSVSALMSPFSHLIPAQISLIASPSISLSLLALFTQLRSRVRSLPLQPVIKHSSNTLQIQIRAVFPTRGASGDKFRLLLLEASGD